MSSWNDQSFSYTLSRPAGEAVERTYTALSRSAARKLTSILTPGNADNISTHNCAKQLEVADVSVPPIGQDDLKNLVPVMSIAETLRVICNAGISHEAGNTDSTQRHALLVAEALVELLESPHTKDGRGFQSVASSARVNPNETMDCSIGALLKNHGDELRAVAENIIGRYVTENESGFKELNDRLKILDGETPGESNSGRSTSPGPRGGYPRT